MTPVIHSVLSQVAYVVNPSFFKLNSAKASALDFELLLQSYGITSADMSLMPQELKAVMMLSTSMIK